MSGDVVDLNSRRGTSPVHRSGDGWNATRWENPEVGVGGYIVTHRPQDGSDDDRTPVRFRVFDDEIVGLQEVVASMALDMAVRAANEQMNELRGED